MPVIANQRVIRDIPNLLRPSGAAARAVARSMDTVFRLNMRRQFDSEGAHGGDKWQPLSPEYKRRKDRLFSGAVQFNRDLAKARGRKAPSVMAMLGAVNKILQLTGDMRRAFTQADNPSHVAEGVVVGERNISVILGAQGRADWGYHQEGAGKLPRRPIISITGPQLRDLRAAANKAMIPYVLQKVRALARIKPRGTGRG